MTPEYEENSSVTVVLLLTDGLARMLWGSLAQPARLALETQTMTLPPQCVNGPCLRSRQRLAGRGERLVSDSYYPEFTGEE